MGGDAGQYHQRVCSGRGRGGRRRSGCGNDVPSWRRHRRGVPASRRLRSQRRTPPDARIGVSDRAKAQCGRPAFEQGGRAVVASAERRGRCGGDCCGPPRRRTGFWRCHEENGGSQDPSSWRQISPPSWPLERLRRASVLQYEGRIRAFPANGRSLHPKGQSYSILSANSHQSALHQSSPTDQGCYDMATIYAALLPSRVYYPRIYIATRAFIHDLPTFSFTRISAG